MPFVSFTRLHFRAWHHLPAFLLHATRSTRQAQRSDGFVTGALSADFRHLTFWTATVWRDEAAMRAYLVSGDHRKAMPKLGGWCDEAAVAHREQPTSALPGADEALEIMLRQGRVSRLVHPSPGHAAGQTVPDGRPPRFARRLPPI